MVGRILRKWFDGGSAGSTAASPVAVEALEGRRLLSASVAASAAGPVVATPAATVAPSVRTFGVTLHAQAQKPFNAYLGDLVGARVNTAADKISASINWGDHSQAGQGVITIGASGHIDVSGAHTYSAAGDYSITITVSAAPIPVPGQPTPDYVLLLGTIKSAAIVAGSSAPGVEIAETVNVPFTATVGSFQFAAGAAGLSATINWGDGKTTVGTLKAGGSTGLVRYSVTGTHTYAKPGEFAVHIVVSQKTGSVARQVASIASKAVVSTAITGDVQDSRLGSGCRRDVPVHRHWHNGQSAPDVRRIGDVAFRTTGQLRPR